MYVCVCLYISATLRTLLTEDALDEDEKFLRNYILGDEWKALTEKERARREKPTYRDIVGQEVDTSEDEEVRSLLALLVKKCKY